MVLKFCPLFARFKFPDIIYSGLCDTIQGFIGKKCLMACYQRLLKVKSRASVSSAMTLADTSSKKYALSSS